MNHCVVNRFRWVSDWDFFSFFPPPFRFKMHRCSERGGRFRSGRLRLGSNGLIWRGLVAAKKKAPWIGGEATGPCHVEEITRINQANHLLGG